MSWTLPKEELEQETGGGQDYIFPEGTHRVQMVEPFFERYRVQSYADLQANPATQWMFNPPEWDPEGAPFITGDLHQVNVRFQVIETLDYPEGGRAAKPSENIDTQIVVQVGNTTIDQITPGEINGEGSAMHGRNATQYGQLAYALGVGEDTGDGFAPAPNFPTLLRDGTFEGNGEAIVTVRHKTNKKGETKAQITQIAPL